MRYLIPCAFILCMSAVNAETTSNVSNTNVQQTTQAVAQKLISLLELTSIPKSEQTSITLKEVVIKALGEGKSMPTIRLATNQAVEALTGKALSVSAAETAVNTNAAVTTEGQNGAVTQPASVSAITVNPAEVTLDPETGKMMATVLPGESIFRLAQRVYGKENGRMYLKIHAANLDKIRDINVVVEGQVLVMP